MWSLLGLYMAEHYSTLYYTSGFIILPLVFYILYRK